MVLPPPPELSLDDQFDGYRPKDDLDLDTDEEMDGEMDEETGEGIVS